MRSRLLRGLLPVAAVAALAAPDTAAQTCPSGTDTFWKVDTLPDDPVGVPLTSQVIVALCEGEAAGSYFPLNGAGPQYIKQASIGLGHTLGETTHQFILGIEVYEGSVGFNPGFGVTMGTKIWDSVADEGVTFTGFTDGMNAFDLQQYNIVVEDDFVVAFRNISNVSFPGCASAVPGVPANVLTDGTGQCSPGKSLLDERNAGWVDPADWMWTLGQTICPTFYSGNWAVRACTTDAGTWEDLGGGNVGSFGPVNLTGSGPLTVGTFNPITVTNANPSSLMVSWIALAPSPFAALGGTVHAFPYNSQLFFFSNAAGFFTAAASWPPGIPTGTEVTFQFFVDDPGTIWGIAMTNAVRGTTP